MVIEFFGEVGGHESHGVGIEFAVVKGNAEMFAAGATLKARVAGEVIGHVVKDLPFRSDCSALIHLSVDALREGQVAWGTARAWL